MFESKKLKEAKYFYGEMVKNRKERELFYYNLSAFLSASRSILQYALEEVKIKNNGQNWFDNQISNNSIFSFLKDKRDINIHVEPISPIKNIFVSITEGLLLSDSVKIIVRDRNGNIKREVATKEPKKRKKKPVKKVENNFTYTFSDWTGKEDIETLSKIYLQDLEKFIDDGI